MAVRVGSARIDEKGKAKGGAAGDQNGREVSTQNWYAHEKGWVVLRSKDPEVGRKIAWDMQAACDNPNIGYDQSQRLTLYNAAKVVDYDCSRVTVKCETDCSALVRVCILYAGINVGDFTTSNEVSKVMNTGKFEKLTADKYTKKSDYLRAGDILVTRTQGHTVVVLDDGPLAEQHVAPAPANPVGEDRIPTAYTSRTWFLRDGPGKNYRKIGALSNNSLVKVYGPAAANPNWIKVIPIRTADTKLIGEKGYVSIKALPSLKG